MNVRRTLNNPDETFGIVGRDAKLRRIVQTIRIIAPSDVSVLIEGESGTGKDLIATAIHAQSHRCSGPLIQVNCAAIPSELFEAELFGYSRDAFDGADHDKGGLMLAANYGTLLLDEIAAMPAYLQMKLFRVLRERKLRRLGDELETAVNFRLLVTTNRNVTALLKENTLRQELYFQISTIKLKLPALRERIDDLPLLAQHFLDRFNVQYDKSIRSLAEDTVLRLLRYEWPGNISELEKVIERAVLFCAGVELRPECLPEELQSEDSGAVSFVIPPLVPIEEIERQAILQTLARTAGNITRTAQILHYPRPTFYRKLKKFGIKVERDGSGAAGKLATSA